MIYCSSVAIISKRISSCRRLLDPFPLLVENYSQVQSSLSGCQERMKELWSTSWRRERLFRGQSKLFMRSMIGYLDCAPLEISRRSSIRSFDVRVLSWTILLNLQSASYLMTASRCSSSRTCLRILKLKKIWSANWLKGLIRRSRYGT